MGSSWQSGNVVHRAPALASQRWYEKMSMELRNSGLMTGLVSLKPIKNFEIELGGLYKYHAKTHGSNFINVISESFAVLVISMSSSCIRLVSNLAFNYCSF